MFKLIRDSLFNPKNIIHYRAKKAWFVILFMLIISIPYTLAMVSIPVSYDKLNFDEKRNFQIYFDASEAMIHNYTYYADESFRININDYNVLFLKNDEDVDSVLSSTSASFYVKEDSLYYVLNYGTGIKSVKAYSLSELLSDDFKMADLTYLSIDSGVFDEIDNVLVKIKPILIIGFFIYGLINTLITILIYALISYLFLNLTIRAKDYMKKEQLFKMMIFSSHGIILSETIQYLFNISGFFGFILLFVGFVPFYVLEREFARRIAIQRFGKNVMDNPSVINKINDLLNKKDDDNDDKEN